MGAVYAEEVKVPSWYERLRATLRGSGNDAFRVKRLTLMMRGLQIVFGLTAVVLSTCVDLPKGIPVRVKREGLVIIDAGVISTMFAFPAYVYLTTIAVITFVGSILFLLLLLVDLSLVGGTSEHESVRYKIDNNVPYLALCFDFIFLVLSMTSACACLGLTNVMYDQLDDYTPAEAANATQPSQPSRVLPTLEDQVGEIFDFKYASSACMLAQSIFIAGTLVLGWNYIEERRKQMVRLGIPATTTPLQQLYNASTRFYKTVSSGVGKRSEERAKISPLFINRVVQVLLSMAAFVVCYLLIEDNEMELVFEFVPAFHVITWISLALFIISFGIAAISAIDLSLTGGTSSPVGKGGEGGGPEFAPAAQEYKGIVQSSGAQFKENLIYARIVYDSLASLLTFCTFAAAAGITSAKLNCRAGDARWCPLSILGVFFAFFLSLSFMTSLFTGSYVEFREHRMKTVTIRVNQQNVQQSN